MKQWRSTASETAMSLPSLGGFVEVRGRPWLVESIEDKGGGLNAYRLACIADDAQGETLEVAWSAEISPRSLSDESWDSLGRNGADEAATFAAYLRTLTWNTATAADRDLFQAPFRAGIRLDAYQLLPLRKALKLPRVNLLIADDVGLGKTVEAGLVVRELLLRRRIDYIVVAAPPSMTIQWQDELESKFGLSFTIIDRDHVAELRRMQGFGVNPWATGSRFIISHRLLADETYTAGLRDLLSGFRARALLILDEAHHAAPASGSKFAIDSQFTRAARDVAGRFEHRLFLTATPHNGHSNSFSALLEMLDPQRFTRGVEVRPKDLEPVMVRRLKEDLRRAGEAFPKRVVDPIVLDGLPADAPELALSKMLGDYGELRECRLAAMPKQGAIQARLVFVGLQQRLLSSTAAFARTLEKHRKGLSAALDRAAGSAPLEAARAFVIRTADDEELPLDQDEATSEAAIAADDDAAVEAATELGAIGAETAAIKAELALVDDMLDLAGKHAAKPDARVTWLTGWIRANMVPGGRWSERRLILFTEFEDTRRWLQKRLLEALDDTDRVDERIEVFSGATGTDRREAIKRAFNADPAMEPLRILICTDAAREGINLQMRCHDLIHIDLPWNPSRLEQRNGRIDRKLQPSPEVFCRYFRYAQREEDIVLDALVQKSETILTQLGSAGRVLGEAIAVRLAEEGIGRGRAAKLAASIRDADDPERLALARDEMDDAEKTRQERLHKDLDDLRKHLERSRERVGVDPRELRQVVGVALSRVDFRLDEARSEAVGAIDTFRLDPRAPMFADDPTWGDAFDDLRDRRRKKGERLHDWRRHAPVRAIAFEPPVRSDGSDAADVVQVHLEHRLVRRLLARFLSQGFQADLERACVVIGPGAQPRVVMLGRLAVYGPGAVRLHEEIIPVTAVWTQAERDRKPLKPFGSSGEETTIDQLQDALRQARNPPAGVIERIRPYAPKDAADLKPELERRAASRLSAVTRDLAARGEEESKSLATLLSAQADRIARAVKGYDPRQFAFEFIPDEERRQKERERRRWDERLREIEHELATEPDRVRDSYAPAAHRLEPVGLVYLWPASN
jgi:hypothetical protein